MKTSEFIFASVLLLSASLLVFHCSIDCEHLS